MKFVVLGGAAVLLIVVVIFLAGVSVIAACLFGGIAFLALLAWLVTAG